MLDIEASGFGRDSYPIEIGYVLSDGRSHCMLIRPSARWTHWDHTAQQVHGISRATLLNHGKTPLEVALALNNDLSGLTVYCDGWAHDYPWLAALFDEAGTQAKFKLESVVKLLRETELESLTHQRALALADLGLSRHRASNDARALQRAVQQLWGQALN